MPAGNRQIRLLQRVVRMREVEKRQAAVKAAQAQDMHGKLLALQDRSSDIAASYSARRDAGDGTALGLQLQFTAGLEGIRGNTADEALRAKHSYRAAVSHLRLAERRFEITDENLSIHQREEKMRVQSREATSLARKLKRPS